MKTTIFAGLAVLLLSGCIQAVPVPPEGTPSIEVYTGNGLFSGFLQKTVYADDTIVTASSGEGGRDQDMTVVQGPPGVFAAVRALVAAEGPGIRVTAKGPENRCLDYGQDRVTARPAAGDFKGVSASCPEPAMMGFTRRVLDAMAAP
jgi:hypothetical protein